ncbi:MAG: hypothetical protein N2Z80_02035 [Hydrogenothermaceae bacterium]|nr:hypothetical protein [Hydrogenothermaceae bacterium]
MLGNKNGFSLVEALIAISMAFFIVIGIAKMLTVFGIYSKGNVEMTCLVNAASSAIEACRGGTPINNYTCNNLNIQLSITTENCNPSTNQCNQIQKICDPSTIPTNQCNKIIVTATYAGKSFSLEDRVCNF